MYQNKSIILLDETLSNVEKELEQKIIKNLFSFIKNTEKTLIIISHSLKSLKDADQIIIMKDGAIVEKGNHEQLLISSDFYKKAYKFI